MEDPRSPPLLLVVAVQGASVIGDALAQRCQNVCFQRHRAQMLLGLTTVSAVQVMVLLALAQLLLPAEITGAVYEGRELKRCCLGWDEGPVPASVKDCVERACAAQGPFSIPGFLWGHPALLLNGLLNIVYYWAEIELYRTPLGLVLIVCSALASTFLLDPVARAFGLPASAASPPPSSSSASRWSCPRRTRSASCRRPPPLPRGAAGRAKLKSSGDEDGDGEAVSPRGGGEAAAGPAAAAAAAAQAQVHLRGAHREKEGAGREPKAAPAGAGAGGGAEGGGGGALQRTLAVLVPFFALSFSYCLWFVTQKYFHDDYGLNAWGYTAVDQGLLPLYIVPFLYAAAASPTLAPAVGFRPGEGVREVAAGAWERAPLASLFAYRLLANGRALLYFYLIILYDMAAVYVTLTLVRVLLSWLVSVGLCLLAPGLVGTPPEERAAVLAPRALALKAAGSLCILAALLAAPR
eukprot:tig00000912_g5449.t1